MMDILPTQVFDDNDYAPTQKLSHSLHHEAAREEIQIGVLSIGTDTYAIKNGINKIGRHPDCNIILNDQTVSKKHAEIEANSRATSAWICDLNSSNKTKLNNSILRPGRCYELKDGSSIELGMVRATYKVHRSMDESLIPETPLQNRQKEQQTVIPGTPDSSLNNSSTLEGNVSMIPGTQAGDGDAVFRRPSVPQRTSITSSRKSFIQDSSAEDSSMDDSRGFAARVKENVGGPRVSIHDMGTQKSFESPSETEVDIHDVETQKICLANVGALRKPLPKQKVDIHDVETQYEEDIETQVIPTNIHDADTQCDEDVHEMKTPEKNGVEDVSTGRDDSFRDVEGSETGERKLAADKENVVNSHEQDACKKAATARHEDAASTEQTGNVVRGSQETDQLSLTTNFEDESELDRSRNLLGSQILLEDFIEDDDPLCETKSPTSVKPSRPNDTNETTEKSSDEENLFDAATQVRADDESIFDAATQRIAHPFKPSVTEEDSDDTDQEGVFQRYSRKGSQDSADPSKSQALGSEDSDTDEEGRFAEIALKEKRASCSFEARQNESKEAKNDAGSSKDSDDLFDTLTQHIYQKNKDPTAKEDSRADVGYDVPTQIIKTKRPEADARPKEDTEVDDLAATQILPSVSSRKANESSVDSTKSEVAPSEEKEDITEMEDNTATQILSLPEKVSDTGYKESPKSFHVIHIPVEECSVEDIDYEMAPTQLFSEVEKRKPAPTAGENSKNASKKSRKMNLDDTLERNLNEMFDDVNEEHPEDQSQISTQVLRNMLQSSQCEDASKDTSSDDGGSPEISKVKKFARGRRSKAPTDSLSLSTPKRRSRGSNLNTTANVDSENSEQYFSSLTSPRKRNVLVDSEDSASSVKIISGNKEVEELAARSETVDTTNERNSVLDTLFKSTPKGSSTPGSPRRNMEESKPCEPILEEEDSSKNDVTVLGESPERVADKKSDTSIDIIPRRQISIILEDDDEDILAGLPEVRISGTLSNPPSPTSPASTRYRRTAGRSRSKQGPKKAAARKRRAPRQPARRSFARINAENTEPYRTVSRPILAGFGRFDVEKASVAVHESDDEKVNEASKQPAKKFAGRLRRSKGNESLTHEKSISFADKQEQSSRSPSIQSNGRTRNSSKENVDRSSVFQVGKEAADAEPAKRTVSNASRVGKRSLSSMDPIESSNAKKRKEDVNGDVAAPAEGRRSNARSSIVNRSNSANILDYMTNRSSPLSVESSDNAKLPLSQSSLLSRQVVIKVARMSPSTPRESMTEGIVSNETKRNQRSSVNSQVASNSFTKTENVEVVQDMGGRRNTSRRASYKESVEVVPDMRTRRNASQRVSNEESVEIVQSTGTRANTSQRASNRRHRKVEEISSQIGEESQEVEMIMNASLKVQAVRLEVEKKKDVSGGTKTTRTTRTIRPRNTRKRSNTSTHSDVDSAESSASSNLYESDNAHFEVPAPKAKRPRISKNASGTANVTVNKPTGKAKRNSKQPSRSTRGHHQSIIDSSVEEPAEVSANETPANNTASQVSGPKRRGRKPKAAKKRQEEDFIEDNTSSGMNSSLDNAPVLSTPSRARRSMSTSFSTSSPFKVKHRILFTGISNNNYSKLLTKLGASQVEDPTKCSVLVTDKVRRTVKFLCALAQSVPIVSVDWLVDSEKAGRYVDLENYILKDPAAEAKFGFRLRGSLEKARDRKLLEGYTIVLTPNVAPPPLPELKSIISSCGGKPLVRPPTSWPPKAVIISREEDLANAKKFLAKAPKTVTVQSTEFILTGILRQELNFVKYKLT